MRRLCLPPAPAAVAVTMVAILPVYLLGGLAVQARAELGVDRSVVGALVAVFFAASALGSFGTGRLADRLGAARMMRLSAGCAALSLLLVAWSPGTGWLAGALVLGGTANGAGQPASNALISRAVAAHRRGLAYGAKQAAIPLSLLLGGLAVPAFGVTVGWRWAFVAGAVLAAAAAATVPSDLEARASAGRAHAAGQELAASHPGVGDRATLAAGPYHPLPLAVLSLGVALGSAVGNALGAFYVDTAVTSGLAPGVAGLSAAAGSAVGVCVRLGLGALADRWTTRYLMIVAAMMTVGALASGLLATGLPAAMLPAVVLAYGLGWAWAGLFTFAVTLTHPEEPGRATGLTQGGVSVGAAAGPLAFGWLAERSGLAVAWNATAVCALLAAATVLVGRTLLLRRRPRWTAALRGVRT